MRIDEIETRKAEIRELISTEGAEFDVDALTEEVRALDAEAKEIRANAEKEVELRNAVAAEVREEIIEKKEERKMETVEVRNSAEYLKAYANYLKSGNDAECRALLSENGGGSVPVPDMVADGIRTAWEREEIMNRVNKTFIKGNLRVGFEKSATGASIHDEGDDAPDEEELVIGAVSLVAKSLKKYITVSDEVMDLEGEAFLNYIKTELAYRIAKLAADTMVGKITAAPTTSTTTAPGQPKVTATTISVGTVADAIGKLSDEAVNNVVIMNKATWSAFKAAQYSNGFSVDPFEGMPVIFNNSLPAFGSATTGQCYAIVGDLSSGTQANYPAGGEITIKVDDLSLAEKDLVKLVGRQFVALEVVAPDRFVRICK